MPYFITSLHQAHKWQQNISAEFVLLSACLVPAVTNCIAVGYGIVKEMIVQI